MITQLTCILEDGTTRAPTFPEQIGKDIDVVRGDSVVVQLACFKANGPKIDLSPVTSSVLFYVKKNSRDNFKPIKKTAVKVPSQGIHRADVTILSTETKCMTEGRYVFDVWLVTDIGQFQIFPLSVFILRPGLIF